MRSVRHVLRILLFLTAIPWSVGCGDKAADDIASPDDIFGGSAYLEVKIEASTGVDSVGGGFPGSGASARDDDPAPDRLFVTEPPPGNFFIWFVSPTGGEATIAVRTQLGGRRYSNCRIPPNSDNSFGTLLFDSLLIVSFPGGEVEDGSLRPLCESVR
ncbi:MAG: hypothetical protein JXO72_15350 [Vicinamibacteria bacterium]|jgi:hypothetical protein|nr:hypothetical protein [Vicinamibacteria bacterium]